VPLFTVETSALGNPSDGCAVLLHLVADVIADPTFGTAYKEDGAPLRWPTGYTGRRAGTEVEVLDRTGTVVLTTGSRYWMCPAESKPGELWVIGLVRPCPDCKLGSGVD
jgi:hypothetical protein